MVSLYSELQINARHDQAIAHLNQWRKRFDYNTKELMKDVQSFEPKERLAESETYHSELSEIQEKLEELFEEVTYQTLISLRINTRNYLHFTKKNEVNPTFKIVINSKLEKYYSYILYALIRNMTHLIAMLEAGKSNRCNSSFRSYFSSITETTN